jgi:hypothetical protein
MRIVKNRALSFDKDGVWHSERCGRSKHIYGKVACLRRTVGDTLLQVDTLIVRTLDAPRRRGFREDARSGVAC